MNFPDLVRYMVKNAKDADTMMLSASVGLEVDVHNKIIQVAFN